MRDEVYFTTLLWQNNQRLNGFISLTLFSELHEIMVNKVTLVSFRRGDRPPLDPPLILRMYYTQGKISDRSS